MWCCCGTAELHTSSVFVQLAWSSCTYVSFQLRCCEFLSLDILQCVYVECVSEHTAMAWHTIQGELYSVLASKSL